MTDATRPLDAAQLTLGDLARLAFADLAARPDPAVIDHGDL